MYSSMLWYLLPGATTPVRGPHIRLPFPSGLREAPTSHQMCHQPILQPTESRRNNMQRMKKCSHHQSQKSSYLFPTFFFPPKRSSSRSWSLSNSVPLGTYMTLPFMLALVPTYIIFFFFFPLSSSLSQQTSKLSSWKGLPEDPLHHMHLQQYCQRGYVNNNKRNSINCDSFRGILLQLITHVSPRPRFSYPCTINKGHFV